jgi:hypothetical protein
MKTLNSDSQISSQIQAISEAGLKAQLDRRKFFRQAGLFGLGAIASGAALSRSAGAQQNSSQSTDTTAEMYTAFLIAEDLATTFYYNGLVGAVVQDPNLAGPGGSAHKPSPSGNPGNLDYLCAAIYQEVQHANYFRDQLTKSSEHPENDPIQTFYFPTGTFDTLSSFLGILNALENAFIGAYIILIQELSAKAVAAEKGTLLDGDVKHSSTYYQLQASVAGSILGVEAEHRVLGRVIGNENPANNFTYEQTDGLTSIYNGGKSAVVALTPFITPGTWPGYSFATALAGFNQVFKPTSGNPPNN